MPYPIIEIELDEIALNKIAPNQIAPNQIAPNQIALDRWLPSLRTGPADTGLALLVREGDRLLGFGLAPYPPNTQLSLRQAEDWLSEIVAENRLQARLLDQLQPKPTNAQFPSLTVAICTKDRPDNLSRCLASLVPLQTADLDQKDKDQSASKAAFEILVIDNAPSDERTCELVASLPSVGYSREPKPGLDFARNHALHQATGELIAFLDDDVVVDRLWLNGLQTAFVENPDAMGFTGLVLPYELETEAQILFEQRGGFQRGFKKIRYGQRLQNNPLYPCGAGLFGAGCNMAFRRSHLLAIGGFDDALDTGSPMPGGGDLDIFYRVVRSGAPFVYEPSYLVYHQHRREIAKLRRQYWSWGLGFMAFWVKSYQSDPPMRKRLIRLLFWWGRYQLKMLARSLLRRQRSLPIDMVLAELWGGVMGLFGGYARSRQRTAAIKRRFDKDAQDNLPISICS